MNIFFVFNVFWFFLDEGVTLLQNLMHLFSCSECVCQYIYNYLEVSIVHIGFRPTSFSFLTIRVNFSMCGPIFR